MSSALGLMPLLDVGPSPEPGRFAPLIVLVILALVVMALLIVVLRNLRNRR